METKWRHIVVSWDLEREAKIMVSPSLCKDCDYFDVNRCIRDGSKRYPEDTCEQW